MHKYELDIIEQCSQYKFIRSNKTEEKIDKLVTIVKQNIDEFTCSQKN